MELVLDLARRWWRFKVKDMSPEKLQIISPTQLRLPHVLGLTPFDICYILNDQTILSSTANDLKLLEEPVMLLCLYLQPIFESVSG